MDSYIKNHVLRRRRQHPDLAVEVYHDFVEINADILIFGDERVVGFEEGLQC